jgi:hypothetical protein
MRCTIFIHSGNTVDFPHCTTICRVLYVFTSICCNSMSSIARKSESNCVVPTVTKMDGNEIRDIRKKFRQHVVSVLNCRKQYET